MASILEIIVKSITKGSGFKDTEKDVTALGKAAAGLNRLLGAAGLAVGAKEIFDYGVAAVAAARESAAAEGELQAALTSSGQATDEYKAKLDALASALENTSLFTDEQVMKAEATLVTFKNLGQDIMPQVIATVADMGQKMGDLGSAAQLAGIVLNAPEQAAARLQRQGIMLTETQKEQIATMMQLGNTAGAQGILLDALNTKFGGQAQAARDAAGGQKDWEVATGRLQESLGNLLLTLGDSGVGGAAVGLVETLDQGAQTWTTNVEQIQLFVEALNRATSAITGTDVAASTYGATVDMIAQIQTGWGVILQASANAAIEATVGWDALAESYGEIQQEAAAAAAAEEAGADSTLAAARAAGQGSVAQRNLAQSIRETTTALAAQQAADFGIDTNRERDAMAQLANARAGQTESLLAFQNQEEAAALAEKKAAQEQAIKEQDQLAQQSAQSMESAFDQAAQNIASAIENAIQPTLAEVWKPPAGAIQHVDEAARQLATIANEGMSSEFVNSLNQQFTGQTFWGPMAQAIAAGDGGALQAAATNTLIQFQQGLVPQLLNTELIKQQVRAQMQQSRLKEELIAEIQKELGAEGITSAIGVVQVAAGDTAVAQAQVTQGTTDMTAAAAAAGPEMAASFTQVVNQLNIAIQRLQLAIGLTERWGEVAGQTAGRFNALNPPAAPGAAMVPNDAQRRMGGMSPL